MLRIVFTESPGCVGALIRWFTGGRASHVGIQFDEDRVLHADKGGVQISTMEQFLTGGRRILAVYEPKPGHEHLLDLQNALSHVGASYDYDGLVGFIIPVLSWRWFRVKLGNPLSDKEEYVCSEFVAAALDPKRRVSEFRGEDGTVNPVLLMRRMAHGKTFTRVDKRKS